MIVGFNDDGAEYYDVYGFDDYGEDEFVCREPYKDCRDCPVWFMCEVEERKNNE